jgi:hypothetical protein
MSISSKQRKKPPDVALAALSLPELSGGYRYRVPDF